MKRGITFTCIAAALVGSFVLGRAGAQEGTAEMKAWEEMSKPGPEHTNLMKAVGNWTCEGKMWMTAGAEPLPCAGKVVFSSVLGNRFLKQDYEGTFMGMPDIAIGYTGFNNATRKYESVWLNNMNTGIVLMTGTETAPGTCTYEGSCLGADGKTMKHRLIHKHVGDDKQIIEMFSTDGSGPEAKCMELTYTRAK